MPLVSACRLILTPMRERLAATVSQMRAVVHVAVVGAVHDTSKATGVARLGHQLLGGFHVMGQAFVLVGAEAVDAGAPPSAPWVGGAAHHHALDALDVDGLVEGLAHALVLEGVLALTLEYSSSSRFWSMPRKMVRSSGPVTARTLPLALTRAMSCTGTGSITSTSPDSSAATRVASLPMG